MTKTTRERIEAAELRAETGDGSPDAFQLLHEWQEGNLVPIEEHKSAIANHARTISAMGGRIDSLESLLDGQKETHKAALAAAKREGMEEAAEWHNYEATACRAKGATGAAIHHEESAAAIRALIEKDKDG